ncbi:MAG: hypothetical protein NTX87_02440 [Planctomycetota bacterium]|nr:hypothetical protein [Planctomycetota bacterium]
MTTGLIEQVAAAETAGRTAAAEKYRVLLLRADKPRAGDVEALAAAMHALGKVPADAAVDVEVLAKAADLEREAAGFVAADAERVRTDLAAVNYHAETLELQRQRDAGLLERRQASMLAGVRLGRCRAAVADLAALRQAHAALFGLPELPPPERPAGTAGMAAVGSGMPRAAGGPS